MKKQKKVVVIGGGTGTFTVLQGLKKFQDLFLTAVITMMDSGGSTGRLRDEFGMLPVGDVRQSLVALSKDNTSGQILRQLFVYRFPDSNSSLAGHNFGNIFLTALTDILGTEEKAILAAEEILNITGKIYPVTTDNVNIVAEYENGDIMFGEDQIDQPDPKKHDCTTRLTRLWTQPKATIYPATKSSIQEADLIVMGPGDFYSSILSNVVISGVPEAIQKNKGKLIYITNLVSKYGQTHDMSYKDYLDEIEKYVGRKPDHVLINNSPLPPGPLSKYHQENSFQIEDDLGEQKFVVRKDLITSKEFKKKSGDKVKRSLIRHDSDKLADAIYKLITKRN